MMCKQAPSGLALGSRCHSVAPQELRPDSALTPKMPLHRASSVPLLTGAIQVAQKAEHQPDKFQ